MALYTCDKHLALNRVEGDAIDKRSSLQHFSDRYYIKYVGLTIFIYESFKSYVFKKVFFLKQKTTQVIQTH